MGFRRVVRQSTLALLSILLLVFAATQAMTDEQTRQPNLVRRLIDSGCLKDAQPEPSDGEITAALEHCPPIDPMFRIENGFNVARINQVSADTACSVIATASEDKTARVFRGDGTALSVLRPPVGAGNSGKARAVAVSPDGSIVVVGGWDVVLPGRAPTDMPGGSNENGIYVFDAVSGKLQRRIGGFPYDIQKLAFSSDGSRLAVTSGPIVAVLDTTDFRFKFKDSIARNVMFGAAFGRDNSLYVVNLDGLLTRYSTDGKRLKQLQIPHYSDAVALAVSPGGETIAIASQKYAGLLLLDAKTLNPAGSVDMTDMANLPMFSVAATGFGSLAAGGGFLDRRTGLAKVRIWGTGAATNRTDVEIGNDTVRTIAPCGQGFLIATYKPTLILVNVKGQQLWQLRSPGLAAFEKTGPAFRATADGRRLWFGLGTGAADPVEFDLMTERLFRQSAAPDDILPPIDDRLKVTGWNEEGEPKLNGKSLPHNPYEIFRAMAQQPDGNGFVLGSEFQLWRFDRAGRLLWPEPRKPPAAVHGVNITRDGRLLLAAYADGTIRWHRLSDGAELLALYVDTRTLAWIAWTPSGYFMSSPGGDELGGWQLNRGFHQAADFFPMAQFRDRYYRPDVIKLVLATLDEGAALSAADAAAQNEGGNAAQNIADRLPPVVTILSPAEASTVGPAMVTLEYQIRSPSGTGVASIEVLVNGRPVGVRSRPNGANRTEFRGILDVELAPDMAGPIELGLVATAGGRRSALARVTVKVAASTRTPASDALLKPNLFALVIGVSDYRMPGIEPLKFAAKDADDIETLINGQANSKLYGPAKVMKLTNAQATTSAVKEGLAWLDANVKRRDVGLIFLAGHGLTDPRGRFWFLTADADRDHLAATALSREDINVTLQSLRGRVIVFLDACHAGSAVSNPLGSVDMNDLVSDLAPSGLDIVIFSSSSGRELSYESPEFGNGAFSKSVIEAVADGRAELGNSGRVTTSSLDAYAVKRVGSLTQERQHPLMFRPAQTPDFDIAAVP